MGFLRRLIGGSTRGDEREHHVPGMARLDGPVVASPHGALYATTTCPYCGVTLDPLPTRRRKCPACAEQIIYAVTPDGIHFLHREGDDLGLAVEAEEQWAAQTEYGAQQPVRPRRLREASRRQMERAAWLGLVVRIDPRDEDPRLCGPCRALGGREYDPRSAPILPFEGCRSRYVCNCRYVLAVPP